MTKGQQSFLGDGYVHYLNHGGGYKDILTYQNSMNCTIKSSILCLSYSSIELICKHIINKKTKSKDGVK